MPTHDPLISAEALLAVLHEPRTLVLDCRFSLADPAAGRRAYLAGHLPGARHCDLERDLSAPIGPGTGRHPLPDAEAAAKRLRALGLRRDSRVVACDERDGMFAARLWWMLRWLGHDAVQVLDGGLARWQALGLPLDTSEPPTPGTSDFIATPRVAWVADALATGAWAQDAGHRVFDARAPERYRGEVEPIDRVAGHVPGARNLPFARSLEADGRLRAPEALRATLTEALAGVPPERALAMCGSGVTACHLLLAFERAGLPGARLYPGSWSEWSADPGRPVARGTEP